MNLSESHLDQSFLSLPSIQFLHLRFPIVTLRHLTSFSLHSCCHLVHFPSFLLFLSFYVSLPHCSALKLPCDRNSNIVAQPSTNPVSTRLWRSLIPFFSNQCIKLLLFLPSSLINSVLLVFRTKLRWREERASQKQTSADI